MSKKTRGSSAFAVQLTEAGRTAMGIHDGYGTFYVDADEVTTTVAGALVFVNDPLAAFTPTVFVIAPGLWVSVERIGTQGNEND